MAYEHVTPQSHPDVLRHWDFFKKVLENTFRLGKLWEEYNVTLEPRTEFRTDIIKPSEYWLNGRYKGKGNSVILEFLSNDNSMYFRTSTPTSTKYTYTKKGKAISGEDFNTALIFEVCDHLYAVFKGGYDRQINEEKALQEKDRQYNNVVEQMKIESGNVLIGKSGGGIADLRIDCEDTNINTIQIYGSQRGNDLGFNINLKNISPLKAARIAKILAEKEDVTSPTPEEDTQVLEAHWNALKEYIQGKYTEYGIWETADMRFSNETMKDNHFAMSYIAEYKEIFTQLNIELHLAPNWLQRSRDSLIFIIYKDGQESTRKEIEGVVWREAINENLIMSCFSTLCNYLTKIDDAIYQDNN